MPTMLEQLLPDVMAIQIISVTSPQYKQELALRYEVLRRPLNMPPGSEVSPYESVATHFVALEGRRVVGCVLMREDGGRARLFQMAVAEDRQDRGIGRMLVQRLEEEANSQGLWEVFLHAREAAIGFYERLGYSIYDEPFTEVGIPHRKMRKCLSAPCLRAHAGVTSEPSQA